jgi:hypothetical protein
MRTHGQDKGTREFPRVATMIPVNIKVAQAWLGAVGAMLPGGLLMEPPPDASPRNVDVPRSPSRSFGVFSISSRGACEKKPLWLPSLGPQASAMSSNMDNYRS